MTPKTEICRKTLRNLETQEATLQMEIREKTALLRQVRAEKAKTYTAIRKLSTGQNEIEHHNEENPLENIDLVFHIEYHQAEPANYQEMTCTEAISA